MRPARTVTALIALGVLLASPFAWGCEGSGAHECTMSSCPMTEMPASDACHDVMASSEQGSAGCKSGLELSVACCDAPVDPEPAKVEISASLVDASSPLVVLVERIGASASGRPPDLLPDALSARNHELGRFTLLSSFLL